MHLLIFGFGYSAARYAQEVRGAAASIVVTARSAEKVARLKAEGWDALAFDGETCDPALAAAIRSATHVLISAPPDAEGDPVLRACALLLMDSPALHHVIYLSTVGVYGDHAGGWVDEATPPRPTSLRSIQRLKAELAWQAFAAGRGCGLAILRLAGIYGPGRSAIDNLRAGTARRIVKPGQVFNRIHVYDIAGSIGAAFAQAQSGVFNISDDEPCPPQEVVAHAARLLNVAPPPEVAFEEVDLSPMARSFYGENKRVSNARLKAELGYRFRYPSYREGLAACVAATPSRNS